VKNGMICGYEADMLERTLKKVIENLSQSFPVLLLTGPRRIGKTTLKA
jgi:predicted AAA+ superfamily ATPase